MGKAYKHTPQNVDFRQRFTQGLKKYMADRHLTLSAFSRHIHMDTGNASRMMNGKLDPGFYTICRMLRAMNISFEELMDWKDFRLPASAHTFKHKLPEVDYDTRS